MHWNTLIDEFRGFGGTAENVVQREGEFGLGLFPIDNSQPVELRAPDHLLVSTDNIELQDNEIVIKDESQYPAGFSDWYRQFQANYSWGAEAKRSIETFEKGLISLPANIHQLLEKRGLVLEGRINNSAEAPNILKRFIATRRIKRNNKNVLMPIIELVNHSPQQRSWSMDEKGISITGTYSDEILVRYSACDPLHRFLQYGFNCNEINGFSLNLKVNHHDKVVYIKGGINHDLKKPPRVSLNDNKIIIDRPMIGSSKRPRIPRTLFKQALEGVNGIDADELFDQVCQNNRLAIISLIKQLDNAEGYILSQLQTACLQQLVAIGYHFGEKAIPD